jgi:hypothetical protein
MSRARDTANQINRVNSSAADATAITVDSSENVGIGTDSSYPLTVQSGTAGSNHAIALRNSSNNFSRLGFLQTDSATAAYTSIDGDGRASGYLKFNTNDTERLRIDSDGLKFHGDTAAANALNDYEEGTFTPTWNGYSSPYGTSGNYIKIGNQVTVYAVLITNANDDGSEVKITNLPFTISGESAGATIWHDGIGLYSYVVLTRFDSNSTICTLQTVSGGSSVGVKYKGTQPQLGGYSTLRWTITYKTT